MTRIQIQDLKAGDRYTFLGPEQGSFYEAVKDYDPVSGTIYGRFHGSSGRVHAPIPRLHKGHVPCTLLSPRKVADLPVGTKFTYLQGLDEDNYYLKTDEGVSHWAFGSWLHDLRHLDFESNSNFRIIEEPNNAQEGSDTMSTIDSAIVRDNKLDFAVDYELRVKFNYTNERGETADRRLAPTYYDGDYVGGESYDANGQSEGYKSFRIDRINDAIVVR